MIPNRTVQIYNGVNPGNLSDAQSSSILQQTPLVQQKSIQIYAQRLAKKQHDSMRNAGGIPDRQPPTEYGCGSRSNGPDAYAGNDSAALQTRVGGALSDSDADGAGGAPTTPTMQAHATPSVRLNKALAESPDLSG